ncbi:Xaa-Pro peptidase family protein [Mameliella sp. AT18]|uniref:M24 family metallopeptidase n=1 Tax=Mameliella sp. AT18 TaxID=3028385 RepID=UPI00237B9658|nr:Xaa-Pro peptidase family protein [Mameliella sp. AT18]MDD9731551.1 Xaa-Pro peptidase family protein [Mameliella sp. AT18]
MKRIQERLTAEGGAAAIITKAPNIRYLSGFWGFVTRAEYSEPRRLVALVVPKDGNPLLIVPKIEYEFAVAATMGTGIEVRRHVEWKEEGETEDSWGLARAFIGAPSAGKVFHERQHMTLKAVTAIDDAFHDYSLADGSGWVDRYRIIKDDAEIDLMRRCGKLAVDMYDAQVAALRAGPMREYELAMVGWNLVVNRCAKEMEDEQNFVNSPLGEGVQLVTSGPRLARSHGSASTRLIGPEDVVAMDYCRVPYLWGYRMGMGRVVSMRPLTSQETDIHNTVTEAYDVAVGMLRPGTPCSEIDSSVRGILVEGGLAQWVVHRTGRGVGIENVELPEIKEGIPDLLEAGMVVSIEPSIHRDGFASRIENTFLITSDGAEPLTTGPRHIPVLAESPNVSAK